MIILDADVKADLPFAVTNSSEEMERRLNKAIAAFASLMDPIADPLRGDSDMQLLYMMQEAEWLVANTTFDEEKMVGDEFAWLMFSGVLGEDPHRVWLFIIRYLGDQLIARNYAQGWKDKHQAFRLELPYLADIGDSLYALAPAPLHYSLHWAKFTQAVVAQNWLSKVESSHPYFNYEAGSVQQDAVERFTGIVESTIDFLAANYPILGQRSNEGWRVISHDLNQARQAWRVNILDASVKLSKELANRG